MNVYRITVGPFAGCLCKSVELLDNNQVWVQLRDSGVVILIQRNDMVHAIMAIATPKLEKRSSRENS